MQSILGGVQSVFNRGTNPLLMFPLLSTEIEGYGLNLATVIPVGNEATFLSDGIGTWYFFLRSNYRMLRRFLLLAVLLLPIAAVAQTATNGIVWTAPQIFTDGASHSATVDLAFPSYAAFVAFNPTALGGTMVSASTAGYSTPGDGGSSTYDWNATSTASPDAATKGSAYASNGIFVVQPTGVATGRWILRMPGGIIHPEQAGAKCDGVTNDVNPLGNLTAAVNASTSLAYNGVIIRLNPNKFCLFSVSSWQVPNGATAEGNQQAITQSIPANSFSPYTSGFIHPANVALNLGTGSKLKNVAVLRQNLPTPTNFQTAMAAPNGVMQWFAENGNLTNVAVNGGSSGAGCQVGDILQVPAPIGDFAWVQVATVTGGAANTVTVLDPGAFQTYPASPVTTRNPVNGLASHCTSFPQLTFTAGTPLSVGVLGIGVSYMEDVTITGFNTPLYATALTARNVQFDGANGVNIAVNGTNGSYFNFTGGELWSAQAAGSYGVAQPWPTSNLNNPVATGGTLNQVGDVLTVSGGTCSVQPQITVTSVSGGAITGYTLSTYGVCTTAPTAPATVSNAWGGTPATVNLLWPIATGGTLNQQDDLLTVSGGTCSVQPQITVTSVSGGAITAYKVTTYGACTAAPANPATVSNAWGGTPATVNLLWAGYDYRPGIAYNVHNNCSGCTFWNLQSHGWSTGLAISNTGFTQFFGLTLETSGFVGLPIPPMGISSGVRVQNCVSATIWDAQLNNFSTGLYLHNTEWQHAAFPGSSCGSSGASPTFGNSGVSVFGGTIGSAFANYKYGVDIGPYSRGQVEGVIVFTPSKSVSGSVPYNVEPNIYGWSIRDALSLGAEASTWIAVDPSSLPNLTANAVPSGNTMPSPMNLMGGLPTTCPTPGTFTGALINNSGVINICP
ncbi:MAG TPA: hypothetical protein VGL95_19155 [Acetobacteraceae bacterium]